MYLKKKLCCFLLILIQGCTHYKNNNIIQPNKFQIELANNYSNYAEKSKEAYDWKSWKLFSDKAAQIKKDQNVDPENLSTWTLPQNSIPELARARLVLMSLLEKKAETVWANPKNTAEAQFFYDCWVEQTANNQKWLTNDINYCKSNFYHSIKTLIFRIDAEKEFVKYADNIHSIYFKHASATVEDSSITSMQKLISELRKVKTDMNIVLYGYTDMVGERKSNQKLSQRRIDSVRNILINSGAISNDRITTKAFGEKDNLINIDTIINNPHSRRVDIFLYKR
jgi:outer membrane protein OmpA-like peptidoglycan-associated protein